MVPTNHLKIIILAKEQQFSTQSNYQIFNEIFLIFFLFCCLGHIHIHVRAGAHNYQSHNKSDYRKSNTWLNGANRIISHRGLFHKWLLITYWSISVLILTIWFQIKITVTSKYTFLISLKRRSSVQPDLITWHSACNVIYFL